jgi:hypothetical protein
MPGPLNAFVLGDEKPFTLGETLRGEEKLPCGRLKPLLPREKPPPDGRLLLKPPPPLEKLPPPPSSQPAVAMPEIGDVFYSLPPDTRKIRLGGQVYYVSPDDFYYQQIEDQNGKKAYKVMGTPDNAPGE